MRLLLSIVTLILALCIYTEASVITYTATSTISQQDADKQAIAGVAMQIRADVSANHITTKKEVQSGDKSHLDKTYSEVNNVHTSIILNGIELEHNEKQKDAFVSTATLNIDKVTAPLKLKLREIQKTAALKDSIIQQELLNKNFASAIRAYRELSSAVLPYERYLTDISSFEVLDSSFLLNKDVKEIENRISDALAKIKLSFVGPVPQKSKGDSIGPITVMVSDDNGGIKGIPVYVEQKRRILAEQKTNENGKITFTLKGLNNLKGEQELLFEINLPAFSNAKGSYRLVTSYSSIINTCKYELVCNAEKIICSSIEDKFSEVGFENTKGALPIIAEVVSSSISSANSSIQKIKTIQMQIDFSGKNFHFFVDTKGLGSSELSAKISVIKKIKSEDIKAKASKFCEISK